MVKKLTFSVNNAEMVNENPDSNFAILSLDFFASGENLHDMYVSEETLLRTADTIKNCPLVWKYDPVLDDVYTHDKDEVPCGFVPESSTIDVRKLDDGRTMLKVVAYVWKKYSGELLDIFKRDNGEKPVSVEMSVFESVKRSDGLLELLDFRYDAITILGTYVTPAIPSANAKVLSFAKMTEEYNEVFQREFAFAGIDMQIPDDVKRNAKRGLDFAKEYGRGGNAMALSMARYLLSNATATPEKIRRVASYFPKHTDANLEQSDPPSNDFIAWNLWGGTAGWRWAKEIVEQIDSRKESMMEKFDTQKVTFPYKSKGDINPALKGITPPVTVAQANAIARVADKIGVSDEKNGWAIAISQFKKTHIVKDEKWVKREGSTAKADFENSTNTEMSMEKDLEAKMDEAEKFEEEEEKKFENADEAKMEADTDEAKMDADSDADDADEAKMDADADEAKMEADDSGEEDNPSQDKLPPEQIGEIRKGVERVFKFPKMMNMEELGKMLSTDYSFDDSEAKDDEPDADDDDEAKMDANADEAKMDADADEAKMDADADEAKMEADADADEADFDDEAKFDEEAKAKVCSMAADECGKGEGANPKLIVAAMYSKMADMDFALKSMKASFDALKVENDALKSFKVGYESQQRDFEAGKFLNELSSKVIIPSEAKQAMLDESKNYSLEQLEAWKTECKAQSLDFALKDGAKSDVVKIGMPFTLGKNEKKRDLWSDAL